MRMSHRELAHRWAHQVKDREQAGRLRYDGPVLISYSTTIGQILPARGPDRPAICLLSSESHSRVTAKQLHAARSATAHMRCIQVPTILGSTFRLVPEDRTEARKWARRTARWMLEQALENAEHAPRCLLYGDVDQARAEGKLDDAGILCRYFGIPVPCPALRDRLAVRLRLNEQDVLPAQRAKRAEREAKESELRLEAAARRRAEAELALERWLDGQDVRCGMHLLSKVWLRVVERDGHHVVETTLGARVPVEDARRKYAIGRRMLARSAGLVPGCLKVGHYEVDRLDSMEVKIGCHVILWEEIERLASLHGWSAEVPSAAATQQVLDA